MTPSSLMVYLVPGVSHENLLRFTADLAGRLKVREVIGIAACPPLLIYGEDALYVTQEVFDVNRIAKEKTMTEAHVRFRAVLAQSWRLPRKTKYQTPESGLKTSSTGSYATISRRQLRQWPRPAAMPRGSARSAGNSMPACWWRALTGTTGFANGSWAA
jgi:hypothetical protein